MKFILIADEEDHEDKSPSSFFSWWEVLLFVLVVTGVLNLLYPQNLLDKVLAQEQPSAVALSYLEAFSKKNRHKPSFLFALIEQEIGMGQLSKAQSNMVLFAKTTAAAHSDSSSQQQWLAYLMLRSKTYKTKMNTPKRITYLGRLRTMAEHIATMHLEPKQLKTVAWDSLSFGKAEVALKIYLHLLNTNALSTPKELAEGGSIAMQNNDQKDSAKFYWAAYLASTTESDKKNYALEAVKVLWAGNFVNEALALTNQLPDSLIKDRKTLLFISHLALAANHPEIAEHYAVEALLLNADKKND
jgi:hypothetical protein